MKNKILYNLLIGVLFLMITGCGMAISNDQLFEEGRVSDGKVTNINVIIADKTYDVILEDNETTKSFIEKMPQEFTMNELNGNEKYVYMNYSLPTNSISPKHIEEGDLMLYGDDCLVIFYKSFDTNYSYTKMGHIDNLPDLGDKNIIVKFVR